MSVHSNTSYFIPSTPHGEMSHFGTNTYASAYNVVKCTPYVYGISSRNNDHDSILSAVVAEFIYLNFHFPFQVSNSLWQTQHIDSIQHQLSKTQRQVRKANDFLVAIIYSVISISMLSELSAKYDPAHKPKTNLQQQYPFMWRCGNIQGWCWKWRWKHSPDF